MRYRFGRLAPVALAGLLWALPLQARSDAEDRGDRIRAGEGLRAGRGGRALPERRWLRNVEVEASLDYLATGLPEAGDVVSGGEERFLDDASPWSVSFVLVLPLAPLDP